MKTNGKTTTQRANGFQFSSFDEPSQSQPLTKAEQKLSAVETKFALLEKKQELETQRLLGTVAAAKSALPVIEAFVGDPNTNLQTLADVVTARGCDIAEDHIEIIIEDES